METDVNTVLPPKRLKIFSDRRYLPEGRSHVTLLVPFWGKHREEFESLQGRRYDRYEEQGRSFFELTSLHEADLAVLPADWEAGVRNHDLLFEFAEKAQRAGKPIVVFLWGMSFEQVPIENAMVFRNSLLRSSHRRNELAVPFWMEDFVAEYLDGKLSVREKSTKPKVGFCGFADPLHPSRSQQLIHLAREAQAILRGQTGQRGAGVVGRSIRTEALRALNRSAAVETNFIIRDRFWAGAVSPDGHADPDQMRKVRLEYLRNMIDTDYNLCTRGAGNASFRLYETLCCGRIPVFIDTDAVLPYDFAADWKKYCVWIEQSELPHIAAKVAEFHDRLSPTDFIDLQHRCRKFWEEWLSPEGFFAHFYLHFA